MLINYIRRLLPNKKREIQPKISIEQKQPEPKWIRTADATPTCTVVLAAVYSYDCGWIMDTAWWNKIDGCWMVTGNLIAVRSHMHYTHWREIPAFPDDI